MPKPTSQLTYAAHKKDWGSCTRCPLHHHRSHVVLARGQLPADVLVVGEGPGTAEDTLGKPFVGRGGKLLDEIIETAVGNINNADRLRWAFTNMIACVPYAKVNDEVEPPTVKKSEGVRPPRSAEVEDCAPRLVDFYRLARPSGILLVGKTAHKYFRRSVPGHKAWFGEISHPAAILRQTVLAQRHELNRSVAAVEDLIVAILDSKGTPRK